MTDVYLKKLSTDEDVDDFPGFISSFIVDIESLLKVVEALKCKLPTNTIETEFFEPLIPYVDKHKPTVMQLLRLSHVLCSNCDIYKPSLPCNWVKNNPELFETDVMFFHRFVTFFKIKNDAPAYNVKCLYDDGEVLYPISDQTAKEKLKSFNTIVKHYDLICNNL